MNWLVKQIFWKSVYQNEIIRSFYNFFFLRVMIKYTAGDSLRNQFNEQFSTKNRDNDQAENKNCAQERHRAWWYNYSGFANLKGEYQKMEKR